MYLDTYAYIHLHLHTHLHKHTHTYTHIYTHTHTHIYTHNAVASMPLCYRLSRPRHSWHICSTSVESYSYVIFLSTEAEMGINNVDDAAYLEETRNKITVKLALRHAE